MDVCRERGRKVLKPTTKTLKQKEFSRVDLAKIIDKRYPWVKLSEVVDWEGLDQAPGRSHHPDVGRSEISTRFMVPLHYLTYAYNFFLRFFRSWVYPFLRLYQAPETLSNQVITV